MIHSHFDEGWGPVGFNKKIHPISIMVRTTPPPSQTLAQPSKDQLASILRAGPLFWYQKSKAYNPMVGQMSAVVDFMAVVKKGIGLIIIMPLALYILYSAWAEESYICSGVGQRSSKFCGLNTYSWIMLFKREVYTIITSSVSKIITSHYYPLWPWFMAQKIALEMLFPMVYLKWTIGLPFMELGVDPHLLPKVITDHCPKPQPWASYIMITRPMAIFWTKGFSIAALFFKIWDPTPPYEKILSTMPSNQNPLVQFMHLYM